MKYLVDTDVLIDFLRSNEHAKDFIKKHFSSLALSAITVAELYAGVRNKREQEALESLIRYFPTLEVTAETAKIGGLLKNTFGKSHNTGLADALIAATAEAHSLTLCSLNKKHFPMVEKFLTPYEKN